MRIKARETAAEAKEIGTALRVCGIWGAMGYVTCSCCHAYAADNGRAGRARHAWCDKSYGSCSVMSAHAIVMQFLPETGALCTLHCGLFHWGSRRS